MPKEDHKALSASRMKTLQSCSWLYHCKYVLRLPDSTNHGALRGTICHAVFELLGNPKHRHHYDKAIETGSAFNVAPLKRLIDAYCVKYKIDDPENVQMIDEMITTGLKFDFWGSMPDRPRPKPTESFDEIGFDIFVDEDDKKYRVRGFIDKLYLFKKYSSALIRDFKTSKSVFEGKDLTDNLQDLVYRLAVKHLYPDYLKRNMQFLFLRFPCENQESEGVVNMEDIDDLELEGFEYFLTDIQKLVDNFSEEDAVANLAFDKGFPAKEDGFSGKVMCGFATYEGQLKKNGDPMWKCAYKLAKDYYVLIDSDGKALFSEWEKSDIEALATLHPELNIEKRRYAGCPAFKHLNREDNPINSLDDDGFIL